MGARLLVVVALGAALFVGVVASPVPAVTPTPAPKLAPLNEQATAVPSSTASGQPKLLGHVYTSAFCSNFVEHFNTATRIVLSNDHQLDAVDTNLRAVENDWNRRDGATRVYDDRLQLIANVDQMLKSIPVSQAAVNQLLAQAKTTTDPDRKAALLESASQLQKTVDRQRAVAYDLTNVIHVLLDKHKLEDTAETNIRYTLPLEMPPPLITTLDDPVPEPGTNTMGMEPSPSPSPGVTAKPAFAEDVMQWTRQRSIIGAAETNAAIAADRVVRICNSEAPPTALPSPTP